MSDTEAVEAAFARHDAFERDGDGFVSATTAVEARVSLEATAAGVACRLVARVPTIDAVVAGETVAPVVQEGWFETFERRLEDVGGATRGEPSPPTATIDAADEAVVVETTLEGAPPARAAADARTVVEYVEGTFVEGLIPGYTYREPASALLERARSTGER